MKSFRDPKYGERYEDVVLDLETALSTTVANNALITAERLHHSIGIMLDSVLISK